MSTNPQVTSTGLDVPKAAAIVVIGSLVLLILIKRGFRGVSAGGVSIGVK